MSQKKNIVIPSGNRVWDYINRGYAICNKCGAVMEEGDDYTYNCPNCGWSVDQDEYVYDDGDPEPQEWTVNKVTNNIKTRKNSKSEQEHKRIIGFAQEDTKES